MNYLHTNNCCHLDLKLENLLLGDDFLMKIADFGQATRNGQGHISGRGTPNTRPPEFEYLKGPEWDIYSLGLVLFMMVASRPAYCEGDNNDVLWRALLDNPTRFWEKNSKAGEFTDSLKKLIEKMTRRISDRCTFNDIYEDEWFNKPIYSEEELVNIMSQKMF